MPTGQVSGVGVEPGALVDLVHQLQGVLARAVPLVDDREHRDAAVPADGEELHRLRLEALGGVDQHHRGVDGGEHAVGVLGEVGVAGGVEQVDHRVAVLELQGRRGDGDAAGLLHVHPVRHRAAAAGLAVHRAGLADDPGVQGQGLGERRLAGVGVADDGERAPPGGLARRPRAPPGPRPAARRPRSSGRRPGSAGQGGVHGGHDPRVSAPAGWSGCVVGHARARKPLVPLIGRGPG